jgi:hypothetical protein
MLLPYLAMTFLFAQAPQPERAWEEEDQLVTRYGAVVLEKAPEDDPELWRITLNGRTIQTTEI